MPAPGLEAARLAAVRQLSKVFENRCAALLGGRKWFSHFESWLWSSRAALMSDANPVPILCASATDAELLRKLCAAGAGEAEATKLCEDLSSLASKLDAEIQTQRTSLEMCHSAVSVSEDTTTGLITLCCRGVDVQCTSQHWAKLEALYTTTRSRRECVSKRSQLHVRSSKRRRTAEAAPGSVDHVGALDFFQIRSAPAAATTLDVRNTRQRQQRPTARAQMAMRAAAAHEGASALTEEHFASHAFSCLARVLALQGGHEKAGGMQAACPAALFDAVRRHFGVAAELFASPLNARFPTYCSAGADVDAPFGSVGSFFGSKPRCGAYLANPPFSPCVVEAMARRMARLLDVASANDEALTFIVVMPHWPDKTCWQRLVAQRHMRRHMLIKQQEHGYVEGGQQYQAVQRWRPSNHDSSILLLQSDAAWRTLPLTSAIESDMRDAFLGHCARSKRFQRRVNHAEDNQKQNH